MRPTPVLAAAVLAFSASAAQANLIANGGFESPPAGVNYGFPSGPGYSYLTNGGTATSNSWDWHKNAGVLDGSTATPWFASSPPSGFGGAQYAFVQVAGSWIAQGFTLAEDFDVTITFAIGSRPPVAPGVSGTTTYSVTAGSLTLTGSTTDGQNFAPASLTGTLAAGSYTLTFLNTTVDPDLDATFFVDDVSVTAVPAPEPATLGLMLAGMLSLAGFRRARR